MSYPFRKKEIVSKLVSKLKFDYLTPIISQNNGEVDGGHGEDKNHTDSVLTSYI